MAFNGSLDYLDPSAGMVLGVCAVLLGAVALCHVWCFLRRASPS